MTVCILYPSFRSGRGALLILVVAATLSACEEQTDTAEPAPRPVRTVTLEKSEAGVPVVLTGRLEALDEASLGFRLSGRMIERTVNNPGVANFQQADGDRMESSRKANLRRPVAKG